MFCKAVLGICFIVLENIALKNEDHKYIQLFRGYLLYDYHVTSNIIGPGHQVKKANKIPPFENYKT